MASQAAPPLPPYSVDLSSQLWRLLDGSRMAAAGGLAGVIARTATAPLDRVKLLFQVQGVASSGTSADAYTGVSQAFLKAGF
jgi:solute carrier family 25 phosphate transporter 23/24/25/41